jgi:Type I restriction-modification system methyltransferase subunit
MELVSFVHQRTMEYLDTVTKAERKAIGQFFTPVQIAEFMGELSDSHKETVRILDPGAGSGILSAALIEQLNRQTIKTIQLDLYENNRSIVPLLEKNLEYIKEWASVHGVILSYRIFTDNFITENKFAWTGLLQNNKYDIVIANPPYRKISKNAPEALVMREIVYGQPNLYFLFMAMGARLLNAGGEFIYIVPRSFSSGLYFTAFRKWFLDEMQITNLHLFLSREAVSGFDSILQETVILRAVKSSQRPAYIKITETEDANGFDNITEFSVPYSTCVRQDGDSFLFFPSCRNDVEVLSFINHWDYTLTDLGYKMKTGIVVDFRETQWLREKVDVDTIPLLWAYNFENNRIRFPRSSPGKPQYLLSTSDTRRLQMKVDNYLLIKRFTSKEERKRLQCALLFKDDFASYESISTENHLNFITRMDGTDLSNEELHGLFVILNSSYMDRYFRILNGSTQVNANEINAIPFPAHSEITQLGKEAMQYHVLDEAACDTILEKKYTNALLCQAI